MPKIVLRSIRYENRLRASQSCASAGLLNRRALLKNGCLTSRSLGKVQVFLNSLLSQKPLPDSVLSLASLSLTHFQVIWDKLR